MPEFEIEHYTIIGYFVPGGLAWTIKLALDSSAPGPEAKLVFFKQDSEDVSIDLTNGLTAQLPQSRYEEFFHVLQTEAPVSVYWSEEGNDGVARIGIRSGREFTGEGPADQDATPV